MFVLVCPADCVMLCYRSCSYRLDIFTTHKMTCTVPAQGKDVVRSISFIKKKQLIILEKVYLEVNVKQLSKVNSE